MSKKRIIGIIAIIIGINILVFLLGFGFMFLSVATSKCETTTDIEDYSNVFGRNATEKYKDKWGMNDEIFPSTIKDLSVTDFKMIYYDPWDKQYLSYLVIDYLEDDYQKEIKRLELLGIKDYIGNYGVTGFTNYKLLAMEADDYLGFVYAITDEKSKIIYVEMIFCNYVMDIDYKKEIPNEYLPDGFNATSGNPYRKKMMNE